MAENTANLPSGSVDAEQSEIQTVVLDKSKLKRVAGRPPFFRYLKETWGARDFIFYDARVRFRSEYAQDKLGFLWTVINPILLGISYYLIFGLLLGTSRGIENFVGFLIIGVFGFQYSSRAVNRGARAISANRRVISAFTFPKLALPMSIAVREAFGYIPILATMIFLITVFPPAEVYSWRWVLIIPAFLCQFMFSLGFSLILARIIAFHIDVANMLSFIMRIWMYSSGVFFSMDRYDGVPILKQLFEFNPLHQVFTVFRQSLLYGETPSLFTWGVLLFWGIGSVVVGLVVFWQAEEQYGKELESV